MSPKALLFHAFLNQNDDGAWKDVLAALEPSIHPVDRAATRIWFCFFPVKLHRALQETSNLEEFIREMKLSGNYRLEKQIDTSAEFLYGHRYWTEVKQELAEFAGQFPGPSDQTLADQIQQAARRAAGKLKVDPSWLVGITAVAFMTLQQVGWDAFEGSLRTKPVKSRWKRTPEEVVRARAENSRPGLRGLLNPVRREHTVTFQENDSQGKFRAIHLQDLTTASAMDKRNFTSVDPRRIEGPVPMECRSASCGTCWVGILAGGERLSAPESLEIRKMKYFGYAGFSGDARSSIRLACQSRCQGNVSIVIPPWNGIIGKLND